MTNRQFHASGARVTAAMIAALFLGSASAYGVIEGITGPTFNLIAQTGYISGADGLSLFIWGYADGAGTVQYPGPTLIVNEGDLVTVNLTNTLGVPTSIVFPGQEGVTTTGGVAGVLTQEAAAAGGTVSYTFTAGHPGTFHYHSGTRPDLQVEMGLLGALIVRPTGYDAVTNKIAYGHADSAYDHEYLFLFTEMDYDIHFKVEFGLIDQVDTTTFSPVYWFMNGRNLPDVILPDYVPWLPTQPYSCLPRMHPGEKLLKRIIGGGRDLHPHHPHGNSVTVIAKDGRLLESAPGAGTDLAPVIFTITIAPGETVDAIFEWTGEGLGWDIYGHGPGDPMEPNEYVPDHGKPFPVIFPGQQEFTPGIAYSGSPFLGALGDLPPGEGGFNLNGGLFYPWHSHHEKEVCNNDIFPGGMFTFLIIEPHGVPIP